MAIFEFDDGDINRGKIVDAGWYLCEIINIEDSPAKKDGSMNTTVQFKILDEGPFKGVILYRLFNEKAKGFVADFFRKGFGIEPKMGVSYNMESLRGRQLKVYAKPGEYDGKPKNDVDSYRQVSE